MKLLFNIYSILLLSISFSSNAQDNLFKGADILASSENAQYPPEFAIDGVISRESTWISSIESRPPHFIELTLKHYCDIDSIILYTGIPEEEKNVYEKRQSAGFWNVKN